MTTNDNTCDTPHTADADKDDSAQQKSVAQSIAEVITQAVPLHRQMRVMDYGCGSGGLTFALADQVEWIIGIDSSRDMVEQVLNKAREDGITNVDAIATDLAGDGQAMPLPTRQSRCTPREADPNLTEHTPTSDNAVQQSGHTTERFDLIASSMTLHHIQNYATLIRNLADMLCPGGYIALADLDTEDGSFHDEGADFPVHHNGLDRREVLGICERAGLVECTSITAHTIERTSDGGQSRRYPVFLVTGQKPAE